MRNLLMDLGHSKRFPGANGFRSEIEWTRAIWLNLKTLIDKTKWTILEVPTDYLTDWSSNRQLINRISWINKRSKADDFLLSIHGNAAVNTKARGVTTCYMGGSEYARKEAIRLSKSYAKTTGIPLFGDGSFDDRTSRFGRIGMVRDTKPLALLIEAGFVSNRDDMLISPQKAAEGIANYLNTY